MWLWLIFFYLENRKLMVILLRLLVFTASLLSAFMSFDVVADIDVMAGKKESEMITLEPSISSQQHSTDNGLYLARVLLHSPSEVQAALLRAKTLLDQGLVDVDDSPIAFVLHGPEVSIFLRENYEQYRDIVDLAAQLSAFNVVDVKVCRTRLGFLGETEQQLVPFVSTVPLGAAEVKRMLNDEGYVYF